jgi:hypothetical protein
MKAWGFRIHDGRRSDAAAIFASNLYPFQTAAFFLKISNVFLVWWFFECICQKTVHLQTKPQD